MARGITSDIILVLAPPWGVDEPHLGLAYLATYLKDKGYLPEIYDMNIEVFHDVYNSPLRELWKSSRQPDWMNRSVFYSQTVPRLESHLEQGVNSILKNRTKTIGFSVTASNRLFTLEMIRRIKERDRSRFIIVGGIGCYTEGERLIFLPPGMVDAFVIGEGEEILVDLLDSLENKRPLANVSGCIYWTGEGYSRGVPRPLVEHLDSIPFPTFDEFPLDLYLYGRKSFDEFTMKHTPILGSRGCVNRCAFCNDVAIWPSFRHRSARHICDELFYESKKRNITAFVFQDLTINGNLLLLREMCRLFKSKLIDDFRFPVRWVSNVIARKGMDHDTFTLMKNAGCHTLMFGIESGSDKVLKLMRKGYTSESAAKVLQECKRSGIAVWINLIVGFPGEGEREFLETLCFIKENKGYIDRVQNLNICNVVESAELQRNAGRYGVVLPDDDMAYLHWRSVDGTNTFEERKRRLFMLKAEIESLGICVENMNIEGEEGKIG
ncbi:MAG: radical SAM protein [Candidatus Omnitrophica bacterium]|nr:radical SAM protein [Candidatus Omnitrophota bacterium]